MEQRQHPRVPFIGQAKIVAERRACEVTISNVSVGGFLLHSDKSFNLGKELTVQVCGVYRKKKFEEKIVGRIVTVHRSSAGNAYGLQFSAYLDPGHHPALLAWVTGRKKKITSFLRKS